MQKKDYTMHFLHTYTTKVLTSLSCVQSIQRFLYISCEICINSLSYFSYLVLSYLVKPRKTKLIIIEAYALH